jgi:Ser/Thr protein kinase RdoA (MazF antagonist)
MPSITTETLSAVADQLGLHSDRFEPTRVSDADSLGNGNWLAFTDAGERLVLRRYHVLNTEENLGYEFAVLRHLAALGWSVPAPVAGPVRFGDRLWAMTRFLPGTPHQDETSAQREERGALLAQLHADLRGLDLGQRPGFCQACDLEAMAGEQDWDLGLAGLRRIRPDLAERAAAVMAATKILVGEGNLLELPQTVVHGDFASWNLHFAADGQLTGVIDFGLTHRDSRSWEFVIARVHRAPELLTGYQDAAARLGNLLTDAEVATIPALQRVFRVNMVMAELWGGARTGTFDIPMIERQLNLAEAATVG